MKLTDRIILKGTFEYNGYLIDIIETEEDFEAWIYRDCSGVKLLMFGMPRDQQDLEEFTDIVEANLNDYIPLYEEEEKNS